MALEIKEPSGGSFLDTKHSGSSSSSAPAISVKTPLAGGPSAGLLSPSSAAAANAAGGIPLTPSRRKDEKKAGAGANADELGPISQKDRVAAQLERQIGEYLTLHRACYLGRAVEVEELLEDGANGESLDSATGLSCLMLAVQGGHAKVATALLARKVNVNLQGAFSSGLTALHYACMNDRLELIKLLVVDAKCKVDVEDEAGNNVVHTCARLGHVQCLDLLLEKAGSVVAGLLDAPNKAQRTPLLSSVINARAAVVEWLVARKVNLNAVDAQGNTALHWAAKLGHVRIATALVKHGAKRDVVNHTGARPDTQAGVSEQIVKIVQAGV